MVLKGATDTIDFTISNCIKNMHLFLITKKHCFVVEYK